MRGISYSNWATLRSCGQRFKLQVLDRVPQAPAVALEFGSALHAGLNDSLITQDEESARNVFEAYWKSVTHKLDFSEERMDADNMLTMGKRFIINFTRRYAVKMRLIIGEKRLFSDLSGVALEGTPDALVEYNGQNVLLDFKSSMYPYLEQKLDSSLQLGLYAWLLNQNGHHVDATAYAVFVKSTGSIQTLRVTPYDAEKTLAMVTELVQYYKRNEGHYEKNPSSCTMGKFVCPYFERCWK